MGKECAKKSIFLSLVAEQDDKNIAKRIIVANEKNSLNLILFKKYLI